MTQRVNIQGGKIVYSATSSDDISTPSVDMTIEGQLLVGNDQLSDGLISAAAGQDLRLTSTGGGNISFNSGTGAILLNNAVWPTTSPAAGTFLSGTDVNILEFLTFFLSPDALSDTLTPAELNIDYPSAKIGQSVRGPSVVYQCVGTGEWRTLGGSGGGTSCLPCPPTDTGIVYASPSADYQLLTGQGWPAIVGVGSFGNPELIQADVDAGWVLTSNGAGIAPSFQPSSGSGGCLPCPPTDVGLVYASPSADYQVLTGQGWPAVVGVGAFGNPELIPAHIDPGWVLTSNGYDAPPSFQPIATAPPSTAMRFIQYYPFNTNDADGTVYYDNWSETADRMLNPEIYFDSFTNEIIFNLSSGNNPFWEVTVNASIDAYSGVSNADNNLPEGQSVYGTSLELGPTYGQITFNLEAPAKTTHWVNVTPDNQAFTNRLTWSDTYVIQTNNNPSSFRVGVYLSSPQLPSAIYSAVLSISVTQIGIPQGV